MLVLCIPEIHHGIVQMDQELCKTIIVMNCGAHFWLQWCMHGNMFWFCFFNKIKFYNNFGIFFINKQIYMDFSFVSFNKVHLENDLAGHYMM